MSVRCLSFFVSVPAVCLSDNQNVYNTLYGRHINSKKQIELRSESVTYKHGC